MQQHAFGPGRSTLHTTNACWILICIALATLSLNNKFSMSIKALCRSEGQLWGREHQRTFCRSTNVHMNPPHHTPLQSRRGDQREGERRRRWWGEGGESENQQLQLATGWRSFAYPHASFISITLPQCKTLHLFCKC